MSCCTYHQGPSAGNEDRPLPHRRSVAGLGLRCRPHAEEALALLKSRFPLSWTPIRSTRTSASFASYAVHGLTGKTKSAHWSLAQYDRSYMPAIDRVFMLLGLCLRVSVVAHGIFNVNLFIVCVIHFVCFVLVKA